MGPQRVPNILRGYLVRLQDKIIADKQQNLESLRKHLSDPRSSFSLLNLGVITEGEKEILERSCRIDPIENFTDAILKRQNEQSLSVGSLKKRYREFGAVRQEYGSQDIDVNTENFSLIQKYSEFINKISDPRHMVIFPYTFWQLSIQGMRQMYDDHRHCLRIFIPFFSKGSWCWLDFRKLHHSVQKDLALKHMWYILSWSILDPPRQNV